MGPLEIAGAETSSVLTLSEEVKKLELLQASSSSSSSSSSPLAAELATNKGMSDVERLRIPMRDLLGMRLGTHALAEGNVVCFTNEDGLPLKVIKSTGGHKHWDLVPTNVLVNHQKKESQTHAHAYLSPECVFTVLRKGDVFGFRSWAAEGRLLQATRNNKEQPRITNYNFNAWESWRLVGNNLQNCAWKTDLPWNVSELRVQVLSMLHESELKQNNEYRELRRALLMTEEKREEMEGHLKHAIQTCQKQMEFASMQTDELQSRLAENLAKNECLSTEVLECQERMKQSQSTIARLSKDVGILETKEKDYRLRSEALEEELSQERVKSRDKVKKVTTKLTSENKKLKRNLEARLKEMEQENEGLRKALDSIASKISKFSAKNTPVESKTRPMDMEMGTPPLACELSASSLEDSDEIGDECILEDDYPVDETLPEESSLNPESSFTDSLARKNSVTEELSPAKVATNQLLESPPIVESPVKSDLINLDSPIFSDTSEKSVSKFIEAEEVRTSPKSMPSGISTSISDLNVLDLQNSSAEMDFVQERNEAVSLSQTMSMSDDAENIVEQVEESIKAHPLPLQESETNSDYIHDQEDRMGELMKSKHQTSESEEMHNNFSRTTTTMGGGKRIAALPPMESETRYSGFQEAATVADYESQDWWNSIHMQC